MTSSTPVPTWQKPADALIGYVNEHKRMPRQSGDRPEAEFDAGNTLRGFRQRVKATGRMALAPELVAYLDKNLPGWRVDGSRPAAAGMRGTTRFDVWCLRGSRFLKKNGRLPSGRSADSAEVALYVFLRNHRQAMKGKGTTSWNDAKLNRLNRMVPGWDLEPLELIMASDARSVALAA